MFELVVSGNVCSKKNLLKFNSKTHHAYYDADTKANLEEIEGQIARQWMQPSAELNGEVWTVPREPLVHPCIGIVWYVSSTRSDRDNKLATIMDCLVGAGVLKDDCIAHCNREVLVGRAYLTPGFAGARIFIEESGDFDRLWAAIKRSDPESITKVKAVGEARKLRQATGFRGRTRG